MSVSEPGAIEAKSDIGAGLSLGGPAERNGNAESNDNSLSIYLDASAGEKTRRDDNNERAASTSPISDATALSHGTPQNRHGSPTPDSEATEILSDDGEDETLYFSISSDVGVRRSGAAYANVPDPTRGAPIAKNEESERVLEEKRTTRPCDKSEDVSDDTRKLTLTPSVVHLLSQNANDVARLMDCPEKFVVVSTRPSGLKLNSNVAVAPLAGFSKISNREEHRLYKMDLKNIKAKIGSRPTQFPPRLTCQSIPISEIGRKTASGKEEPTSFFESPRKRPPIKVALVLKPIRGGNALIKRNQNAAACDSKKPKRQTAAFGGMPSRDASHVDAGMTKDRDRVSPGKVVQEVTDKCLTKLGFKAPSAIRDEERVEDFGKELALAPVDRARNYSQKVSKLGPSVRPPRKATQGAVPPAGPESSGYRPYLTHGPKPKDGSPSRAKQLQNASQGVSKPERRAWPTSPGFPAFNPKTPASQPPASGPCGRPIPNPASKLPVKGLSSQLVFSSAGCAEDGKGSKVPPVSNPNTGDPRAKMASGVAQAPTKQAPPPLQRRGSARFAGLNGTVDKNKPRDAHGRSANHRGGGGSPALPAGNRQQNSWRAPVGAILCQRNAVIRHPFL
ncbi:uncharacterized protein LOC144077245 [Stigmatopora argus]